MNKPLLRIAAFSGALSVALGAFGAHGLKKIVSPEMVAAFETGVRYQFYHTFALIAVALLAGNDNPADKNSMPSGKLKWAARLFITGIFLFSGSLYLLTALQATHTVGLSGIGIITPIGGICFITGWILLAL